MRTRPKISMGTILVASFTMFTTLSYAADPIVGSWATKAGTLAKISPCGGSFCIRITSGPFRGKPIGKMTGSGGSYKGQIRDPENSKTYSGSARIRGGRLYLKGCAAKIFCRTQRWTKR